MLICSINTQLGEKKTKNIYETMLVKQTLTGSWLHLYTTRANYIEGTRHRMIKIRRKIIPEQLFSWNLIVEYDNEKLIEERAFQI